MAPPQPPGEVRGLSVGTAKHREVFRREVEIVRQQVLPQRPQSIVESLQSFRRSGGPRVGGEASRPGCFGHFRRGRGDVTHFARADAEGTRLDFVEEPLDARDPAVASRRVERRGVELPQAFLHVTSIGGVMRSQCSLQFMLTFVGSVKNLSSVTVITSRRCCNARRIPQWIPLFRQTVK